MKKNFWIIPALALLVVTGCSKQNIVPPTQPSIPSNSASTGAITTGVLITGAMGTGVEDISNYSEELILNGVIPKEAYTASGPKYTLIIEKKFTGYSDRIFFPKEIWDGYLEGETDLMQGNRIFFKGDLIGMKSVGSIKYYEVKTITELKKVGAPTKEEVVNLLDQYGYCKDDKDCTTVYGKCPLPCHIAVNTRFSGTVEVIVDNFRNSQKDQCTYKCMEIKGVSCNKESKCEVNQ